MECSGIDPVKDVQNFIQTNSTFADNDRLRNLYKELGLFQPLASLGEAEGGAGVDKPWIINAGLLVEKTSRSMAHQLKQMEENRKKRVYEDELQKREELKLKKIQALADNLKQTREFLQKLGDKAVKGTLEAYLLTCGTGVKGKKKKILRLSQNEEDQEDGGVSNISQNVQRKGALKGGTQIIKDMALPDRQTFKMGASENIDQILYLMIALQKPVGTEQIKAIKSKLGISATAEAFLDPIIQSLSQFKFSDSFTLLQKVLENYKERMSGQRFETILRRPEEA